MRVASHAYGHRELWVSCVFFATGLLQDPAKAKVTRRFLATEGLFYNFGDICPLPKLVWDSSAVGVS